MWHTFTYHHSTMYIAAKAWSDFSAHIPLIRSFSWGKNFPLQDPLFAGEPTSYHFLFYFLVGMLERFGLPLSLALNLPSVLGFFGFLCLIYAIAQALFKNRLTSVLSVFFLIFNGSLSFLEFFKTHPLSWQTPKEIISNTAFPSFGPYDGKTVSAFWNLNIYTNQRHLAPAYALILILCLLAIKPQLEKKVISSKKAVTIGLLLAAFPFFHSACFGMAMVIIGCFFLLFPRQRKPLFIALAIGSLFGLPQLMMMQTGGGSNHFRFHPGYLIADKLNFKNFFHYWIMNLGLAFFLIPLGFSKARSLTKKFFLAFLPLFIIGNLFQFSPEIAANHKFFNLPLAVANILVAYTISLFWQKKILGKLLAVTLTFFLILSGLIDFFPIKNDRFIAISDAPKNPDVLWIKKNTPPDSIFLNSSYLYHPASLAGRRIFLGWPYFPWAGGYDTFKRSAQIKKFFKEKNKTAICSFLFRHKLSFVALDRPSKDFPFNPQFWQNNFSPVYQNRKTGFKIYKTAILCR